MHNSAQYMQSVDALGAGRETLKALVSRVCREGSDDQDTALALELCEVVRKKTSHAHAVIELLIPYLVDDTSAQCVQALFLLDLLVINGGYPVHLAITKRSFLNKLVYRFPPGPQHPLDATHDLILHLLQKWVLALCERSRHRNDFGNIRLMYSLLRSKGFAFKGVDESEIQAIVGLGDNDLKSRDEILEEQRIVLEAKLEDLLRRGTAADLKAANELMQVDSSYSKADSMVSQSLARVEENKSLLEGLLWNYSSQNSGNGESIKALIENLEASLPKLEQMALVEAPPDALDRIVKLTEAVNILLGKARDYLKCPTLPAAQNQFSLLTFVDDDVMGQSGTVPIQGSLNPAETSPSLDWGGVGEVKEVSRLQGPGVVLQIFERPQPKQTFILLFNHSGSSMASIEVMINNERIGCRDLAGIDSVVLGSPHSFHLCTSGGTLSFKSQDGAHNSTIDLQPF